jgi:cysteinyl-tRNA synthetase
MKSYIVFAVLSFILLIGALGTNIYTQYQLTQLNSKYSKDLDILQSNLNRQKEAKNTITSLWENQAATNDKLILAQDQVDQKTTAYMAEIKKSIRFVNTVPQLLPGANETNLKAAEQDLNDAKSNLERVILENTDQKTSNKEQIDAIFLNLGEDQNNRANPRDGTR